jgi:hypothetical protein
MTTETMNDSGERKTIYEEITAGTDELLDVLSDLAKEATVRKITVRNRAGKHLFEVPLLAGVAGVWFLGPWTAALLAGALFTGVSILIEREVVEKAGEEKSPEAAAA